MEPLVQALLDPAAYDHPVAAVQLLETHISWVFLTGPFAYKVKKPVNLGFVDFSSAERRLYCCQEEVRLNRRLAPDLYLGVVPIHGPPERASFHGSGAVIEAAVQMRQFRQEDLLPEALARHAVQPALIDRLAQELAGFHATAATAPAGAPWGTAEQVLQPALANLDTLAQCGRLPADHGALRHWITAELKRLDPLLRNRCDGGRIRECHGDLHLGNMALHGGRITVFDGLEFSEALRWIDPISDLAFLLMDLRQRGHAELALRLLNGWLEAGGDHGGLRLLPWYSAYRALVRAKVTALRLAQGELPAAEVDRLEGDLAAYLAAARQAMAPPRGSLVITHGVSGSGKSHAAGLLRQRGWIQLRSDVERLRLFGRWGSAGFDPSLGADPYAASVSEALYGTVLEDAAAAALAAGLAVVVDATFLKRQQRQGFRRLAAAAGVGFGILDCPVSTELARHRIASRQASGVDPSEADASVLEQQLAGQEPLDSAERAWVVDLGDPLLSSLGEALPVPPCASAGA